jgi:sulfoacetaldehyde dehydrogenase
MAEGSSPARVVTEEQKQMVTELVARGRSAMKQIEHYDQQTLDRLIQAVGWAVANDRTFQVISDMGIDESSLGDREGRPSKRMKIRGILRDALRAKSVGVIEETPPAAWSNTPSPRGSSPAWCP